nr:hypothetical protein [Escherichia coli]
MTGTCPPRGKTAEESASTCHGGDAPAQGGRRNQKWGVQVKCASGEILLLMKVKSYFR